METRSPRSDPHTRVADTRMSASLGGGWWGVAVVETKNLWLESLVDAEIVGRLDRVWPGAG